MKEAYIDDVIDSFERAEKERIAEIERLKKIIEECQEIISKLWAKDCRNGEAQDE